MTYKQKINEFRKTRKMVLDNIELINNDLMFYDDKIEELLVEHLTYTILLKKIDKYILSLQPWYRKFIGIPY